MEAHLCFPKYQKQSRHKDRPCSLIEAKLKVFDLTSKEKRKQPLQVEIEVSPLTQGYKANKTKKMVRKVSYWKVLKAKEIRQTILKSNSEMSIVTRITASCLQ